MSAGRFGPAALVPYIRRFVAFGRSFIAEIYADGALVGFG
jgi:hypothetical protein